MAKQKKAKAGSVQEARAGAGAVGVGVLVNLDRIEVDGANGRGAGDEQAIKGLAESIDRLGQLVAIRVSTVAGLTGRPVNDEKAKYRMVFGHRRLAAMRLLGWPQIGADIYWQLSEAEILRQRAVENLEREDLNPVEEAVAVVALVESFSARAGRGEPWEVEDIDAAKAGELLGRSAGWIKARCYLTRLGPKAQGLVASGRLPLGQAKEICKLADPEAQYDLARDACHTWGDDDDPLDRSVSVMSVGEVRGHVAARMATLRGVPWKPEEAFAGGPPCEGCHDNSAHSLLFTGGEDDPAPEARCLNVRCHQRKMKQALKAVAKAVGKAKENKDVAPTAAGVRKITPSYVKETKVARELAKARGIEPKGKQAATGKAAEKPRGPYPETLLAEALNKWEESLQKALFKVLQKRPLKAMALVAVAMTRTFQGIPWKVRRTGKGKEQAEKILGLVRRVVRGEWDDLLWMLGDMGESDFWWANETPGGHTWFIEQVAEGLGVELPRKPGLEHVLPKEQPPAKPKAEKAPKPKAEKAAKPKAEKKAAVLVPVPLRVAGVCRFCGCTEEIACVDERTGTPCAWVEPDLCSVCERENPVVIEVEPERLREDGDLWRGYVGAELVCEGEVWLNRGQTIDLGEARCVVTMLDVSKTAPAVLARQERATEKPEASAAGGWLLVRQAEYKGPAQAGSDDLGRVIRVGVRGTRCVMARRVRFVPKDGGSDGAKT